MLTNEAVNISAILDIESGEWLYREHLTGPMVLAKGGPSQTAMNTETQQQTLQNQLAQQQLQMQQNQISMVNPTLQSIISGGGFLPGVQSALTSQALNSLPQQYNNLYGQLSNQLVQRGVIGGQNAGGGQVAAQFGSLGAQEAGQQAQLLSQIPIQGQQNVMGALNTALGVSGQYGQNVGAFNQGASSAGSSAVTAANAATQAQTGFWGSLFGALTSPFNITAKV
jgi:hypothetical protein